MLVLESKKYCILVPACIFACILVSECNTNCMLMPECKYYCMLVPTCTFSCMLVSECEPKSMRVQEIQHTAHVLPECNNSTGGSILVQECKFICILVMECGWCLHADTRMHLLLHADTTVRNATMFASWRQYAQKTANSFVLRAPETFYWYSNDSGKNSSMQINVHF